MEYKNDTKEIMHKLGIPFGVPLAAISNPEDIVLNAKVADLYVQKVLDKKDANLFKAKQGVVQINKPSQIAFHVTTTDPHHENAMNRLNFLLRTQQKQMQYGDLKQKYAAEKKALAKLEGMLTEEQLISYEVCGMFWENSKSRRFRYFVRKNRPVIAFRVRKEKGMHLKNNELCIGEYETLRLICSLCIHPIGYYFSTYAGLLTPTDDVINFVQLIRTEERMLWRLATKHKITAAEAGIG